MAKMYGLPRCRPEEQGIDTKNVLSFIEGIEKSCLELHGFMLLRHGHIVSEGFWQPYGLDYPHSLFSLSKSFTSTAIGFAASEGLISLEDKVISFFPEYLPEKPDTNLAAMRIRHLLSMATGHEEDTTDKMQADVDGNWVKGFLKLPVKYEPGTFFLYNTGATYMLSAILRKVSGQNLLDYLGTRLFEPLGIEGATWEVCPRGTNVGGWGLSIKLEDIAKFGQLYLQKGQWLGSQLLPVGWVEEATTFKVPNGDNPEDDWNQGYCYQFWRCRYNAYRGDGAFGQFCIVMPEQDAVFAAVSGLGDMQAVMSLCWEHLLLSMSDSVLPENDKAYAGLQSRLATLAYQPPQGQLHSKLENSLSGMRFRLHENVMNITDLSFHFGKCENRIIFQMAGNEISVRLGKGEWFLQEGAFMDVPLALVLNPPSKLASNPPSKVAASSVWLGETIFAVTLRYIETPFVDTFVFHFEDDRLRLHYSINVSFGPTEFPDFIGQAV